MQFKIVASSLFFSMAAFNRGVDGIEFHTIRGASVYNHEREAVESFKEHRGLKSRIELEASLDDKGTDLDVEDTGAKGKIKLQSSKSWSGKGSKFEIDLDLEKLPEDYDDCCIKFHEGSSCDDIGDKIVDKKIEFTTNSEGKFDKILEFSTDKQDIDDFEYELVVVYCPYAVKSKSRRLSGRSSSSGSNSGSSDTKQDSIACGQILPKGAKSDESRSRRNI